MTTSSADTNPETCQRGRDATRAKILAAATDLFARDGFDNTSVRAIAQRCNLTDPALYYYYPSKRALLDALWDVPEIRAPRVIKPAARLTPERLSEVVDVMLDALVQQDAIGRLTVRAVLDNDQTAIALRNQTMAYWRRSLLSHFETCYSPGEAARRADGLVMLMIGIIFSIQMEHRDDLAEHINLKEFRDHAKALVAVGIPLDGFEAA